MQFVRQKQVFGRIGTWLRPADAEPLAAGLCATTRLIDLDGEDIPGLLTPEAGAWWYQRGSGAARRVCVAQVQDCASVGVGGWSGILSM